VISPGCSCVACAHGTSAQALRVRAQTATRAENCCHCSRLWRCSGRSYSANISPATVITVLRGMRFAGKTALNSVARLMQGVGIVAFNGRCCLRYVFRFWLAFALGVVLLGGCGEDRIPCESVEDCPPVDPGECEIHPLCQQGSCRYYSDRVGAGCARSDGSVGVCEHPITKPSSKADGCTEESGPISCKHGYNDCCNWEDGALCRSQDLREGTCLDGVCGGEQFCEGVVCDEPDNLCGTDQFCNWEGVCEFRQVTKCPSDGSTCTFDECDPDIGCVYPHRPDGADCVVSGNFFCCLFGDTSCCTYGTCRDGVCVSD